MLLRAARLMLIIVKEQQCKSRIVLWGAQISEQSDGMKKEIDFDPRCLCWQSDRRHEVFGFA